MSGKQKLLEDVLNIAKENVAMPEILEFSISKGVELADYYQVDKKIVSISICFMDIKLKEAKQKGKIEEHITLAVEFAKKFLKEYDLTAEEVDKIINGIEAHHGKVPFRYKEAEVVSNADCYIFIHPLGVFQYINLLVKRGESIKSQVEQLKGKLEEKYQLLTLDKAKEELEEYYQMFQRIYNKLICNIE